MEIWEKLLIGVFAIIIILWFGPGVKKMLKQSQEAEKDWPAVLIPIGLVVLFVILLVMAV